MTIIRYKLPISPQYDSPIFESVALQMILGLLAKLVLDGGGVAQLCGIAMVAFWIGAVVLIWRHPQTPTRVDLELIRFGYLPVVVLTCFITSGVWRIRGFH